VNNLIEVWRQKMAEKQGFKTKYPYKKWLESLKRLDSKKLSAIAAETHHSVFSKLDCLHCANCCKNIPPIINETDVNRIAKYLRIKPTNFKQQFTQHDEDGDLVINQTPCPFLGADNYCSIYDVRPKACKAYPHTDGYDFGKNLKLHAVNATFCPAAYHILEQIKQRIH
jgi:uncharacterized protein